MPRLAIIMAATHSIASCIGISMTKDKYETLYSVSTTTFKPLVPHVTSR